MKLFDTKKDAENIQVKEQNFQEHISSLNHILSFHLMPPVGWMNDPNGLCEKDGIYHIYFQYDPYFASGEGLKYWGHYETKDFMHYKYDGVFLSPDEPTDKDGVYSGCAMVDEDTIYYYYTGNVLKEGDFDYTSAGRGSNTTLVTSADGITHSEKECLLSSHDYPAKLSCHVRDPKVWKQNDRYYMVLGGRTKDAKGCVMIYTAKDQRNFSFSQFIDSPQPFGYMWECPDIFTLGDQTFLSISPQGITQEEYRFQNVYHSGYFPLCVSCESDTSALSFDRVDTTQFAEWDMGFDFYAPQTFLDERGRRILIGWIGNPDAAYENPTVQDGWQHALTLPRELSVSSDGHHIFQNPIKEIEMLRKESLSVSLGQNDITLPMASEILIDGIKDNDFSLTLDGSILLSYSKESKVLCLSFQQPKDAMASFANGHGRTCRKVMLNKHGLSHLRLFLDSSCLELYINKGEHVMTSRFYPANAQTHCIHTDAICQIQAFVLEQFTYEGL